jgi:ADP-L-glycero-D-manno-heptose 6-epimerase
MIIVTGANGFIGSCLIADLQDRGLTQLVAVDSVDRETRPEPLRKHKLTAFLHTDQLPDFLERQNPRTIQAVFHLGACSSTTETNMEFLRHNNTNYTALLFQFCTERQIPFIYASSAATYGAGGDGFDDEKPSESYTPLNPYGWSKLHFDIWALQQTETPPRWAGLKLFNVYGPNEYHKGAMSSVVYKAFEQIRDTGRLRLFRSYNPQYADGLQMRDFVYVKDVTTWMIDIWQAPHFVSGIYNMGFGKARTWLDLAAATFASMNREMQIEWIEMPESVRTQYQYFTEAKMTKLMTQGLKPPSYSLEDGVRDYVQNYLQKADRYW